MTLPVCSFLPLSWSLHQPLPWILWFYLLSFLKNTLIIYVCIFKQYATHLLFLSFMKIILHYMYLSVTCFCLLNNIFLRFEHIAHVVVVPPFCCCIIFHQMIILFTHFFGIENWAVSRSLLFLPCRDEDSFVVWYTHAGVFLWACVQSGIDKDPHSKMINSFPKRLH